MSDLLLLLLSLLLSEITSLTDTLTALQPRRDEQTLSRLRQNQYWSNATYTLWVHSEYTVVHVSASQNYYYMYLFFCSLVHGIKKNCSSCRSSVHCGQTNQQLDESRRVSSDCFSFASCVSVITEHSRDTRLNLFSWFGFSWFSCHPFISGWWKFIISGTFSFSLPK